jgi:hypothetical protein
MLSLMHGIWKKIQRHESRGDNKRRGLKKKEQGVTEDGGKRILSKYIICIQKNVKMKSIILFIINTS